LKQIWVYTHNCDRVRACFISLVRQLLPWSLNFSRDWRTKESL
jgi:hypothetical protein